MWDAFQHFQTLSYKVLMIRVPWKWASRTTCAISRILATWKAAFMRAEAATQAPFSLRCVARNLYVCFIAFVLRGGKHTFSSCASLHEYFTRIPAVPSSKLLLEKGARRATRNEGLPAVPLSSSSAAFVARLPSWKNTQDRSHLRGGEDLSRLSSESFLLIC